MSTAAERGRNGKRLDRMEEAIGRIEVAVARVETKLLTLDETRALADKALQVARDAAHVAELRCSQLERRLLRDRIALTGALLLAGGSWAIRLFG